MELWTEFVDLIYAALFSLSVVFGGNMGMAIAFVSVTFRVALLPLTLRMAHRSVETQAALRKLEPQLSGLRKKYKDDPGRIWKGTARLHRKHGIRLLDGTRFATLVVQFPLFLGVFAAVRRGLTTAGQFLWIKDLTKPDMALAFICAALTGLSAAMGANVSEQQRFATPVIPVGLTLLFLLRMASGIAIYTFASGWVGFLQSFLVRRRIRQLAV